MADDYITALMAAVRAAALADPAVTALIGSRFYDEPPQDVIFPYVRFGRIEPVTDDTDGTTGAAVTFGLEVHSRPDAGRVEAARICAALKDALHRASLSVADHDFIDIQALTWAVDRAGDGASYEGRLALEALLQDIP